MATDATLTHIAASHQQLGNLGNHASRCATTSRGVAQLVDCLALRRERHCTATI